MAKEQRLAGWHACLSRISPRTYLLRRISDTLLAILYQGPAYPCATRVSFAVFGS